MKKKNYFQPIMRLHELKSGRIMAASLGEASATTTTTPSNETKPGVEDFEENNNIW